MSITEPASCPYADSSNYLQSPQHPFALTDRVTVLTTLLECLIKFSS